MTRDEFKAVIAAPEYDFLRQDPHLGSRIMFLTLGGSHAYGTNVEGSDVDVRGVATNSKKELLGLSHFEQFMDSKTDTTVYGFSKFIGLISACNPNTIEMLGGKPDQYLMVSPEGQLLLDNKNLFLSKRAVYAFGGYAQSQLRRLQVAVAKEGVEPMPRDRFTLNIYDSTMHVLGENHRTPHGLVQLILSKELNEAGEPVVVVKPDAAFGQFQEMGLPLNDLPTYLSELHSIAKNYGDLGRRNSYARQKGDSKLNKHAMHLVRLYLMAFDILEKGEIRTYRENDRQELLDIRNGAYMQEDGTFRPEFFEMVSSLEIRMQKAAEGTSLPERPDAHKIEELMIAINETAVKAA